MNTHQHIGAATLAADELLLDGRLATLAAAVRATAPAALRDQLDAATDHVEHRLRDAAAAGHGHFHNGPADDHPAWVRLGALHALVSWTESAANTCMHAPTPTRPQPIAAAAWKPDLVVCARCTHLLALPRNSAADRTCDGCGHLTGTQQDDGIHPGLIQLGPLMWSFGACTTCHYRPAPPATSAGRSVRSGSSKTRNAARASRSRPDWSVR